ncbi:MAG: cupredoxin domain-containing protein [Solirubrobacterales bacterium]
MKGRGTALAAAAAVIAVGVLYGTPVAGGDGATAAKTRSVRVDDDFFRPKRVTIRSGDRVRWVWRGEGDHNVRFRKVPRRVSRRPGSRTVDRGRFSRKFRKRGRYSYVCTIHEDLGMTGSVKVR